MENTGSRCTQSGIYRSNCGCRARIAMSEGETFPPCGKCGGNVSWVLVDATDAPATDRRPSAARTG